MKRQSFLSGGAWSALALLGAIAAPVSAQADSSRQLCTAANVGAVLGAGDRETVVDLPAFYAAIQDAFPVYAREGQHFEGTDAILNEWNDRRELKDPRWLAYILATAYHETAQRMFPIRETLALTDESAVSRLANSACCGNHTYWREHAPTGEHYFGRGYVQLTWYYNYQRVDDEFTISYETESEDSYYWNPSLALDPETSIRITYDGMIHGWFVPGHCLLRHFRAGADGYPNQAGDWLDARRIINGRDRDALIAEHADHFLAAIEAATVPAAAVIEEPPTDADDPAEEPQAEDPNIEDPTVEDPTVEDPTVEDPAIDDPVVTEPGVDETETDESTVEEPLAEEPGDEDVPVLAEEDAVPDLPVLIALGGVFGLGILLTAGSFVGRAFAGPSGSVSEPTPEPAPAPAPAAPPASNGEGER